MLYNVDMEVNVSDDEDHEFMIHVHAVHNSGTLLETPSRFLERGGGWCQGGHQIVRNLCPNQFPQLIPCSRIKGDFTLLSIIRVRAHFILWPHILLNCGRVDKICLFWAIVWSVVSTTSSKILFLKKSMY